MAQTPFESFTVDEGIDAYGIRKQVTLEGDQAVTKLTYDAQPMLEAAHAERVATAGERWGEMRKVGTMPMAVYAEMIKLPGATERQVFALGWLRANPRMVTFDKFLK